MYSEQKVQDLPIEEISSDRRNAILADVMAQLDYIEKRGSGLKRIYNETKNLESYKEERKPVFKSSSSYFITIIYSMMYGGFNGGLNESQKSTLEYICQHEGYNTNQISVELNVPFGTIDKHIRVLLKKRPIEHRGSKKTGGYYML